MVPLVIPVSVPVRKSQTDPQAGGWMPGRPATGERLSGQSERKPSVIVARRRSLRNSVSDSFGQVSPVTNDAGNGTVQMWSTNPGAHMITGIQTNLGIKSNKTQWTLQHIKVFLGT